MRIQVIQNILDILRGKKKIYSLFQKKISYWDLNGNLLEPYYIVPDGIRNLFIQNTRFEHAFGLTFTSFSKIGKNITFHNNVSLAVKNSKGPTIGDNCILFPKCSVIGDVTLGNNCVVGNMAVVTKSFPPYSILVGNPARLLKTMPPDEFEKKFGSYAKDRLSWKETLIKYPHLQKPFRHILENELKKYKNERNNI